MAQLLGDDMSVMADRSLWNLRYLLSCVCFMFYSSWLIPGLAKRVTILNLLRPQRSSCENGSRKGTGHPGVWFLLGLPCRVVITDLLSWPLPLNQYRQLWITVSIVAVWCIVFFYFSTLFFVPCALVCSCARTSRHYSRQISRHQNARISLRILRYLLVPYVD